MMKRFVSHEGWSPSWQDHPWQTGQRVDEQFLSGLRVCRLGVLPAQQVLLGALKAGLGVVGFAFMSRNPL